MRFSQRIGLMPVIKLAQRESIDDDLRSSLWNLLTLIYWNSYKSSRGEFIGRSDYVHGSNIEPLIVALWLHYFKEPIDTIDEYWVNCRNVLRKYYFSVDWYEVYDFIEFIANYGPNDKKERFIEQCNSYLERESSAYRFVNGLISEITSAEEISEVEAAIAEADRLVGVKTHIKAALALLSDRRNPDYRNSIKESISAVESLAKYLAGEDSGTLGQILKELEKSKKLHPALKSAFSSLYGYSSDADGIRHALLEEVNLTQADARFMLVCCSAFINYSIIAIEA